MRQFILIQMQFLVCAEISYLVDQLTLLLHRERGYPLAIKMLYEQC